MTPRPLIAQATGDLLWQIALVLIGIGALVLVMVVVYKWARRMKEAEVEAAAGIDLEALRDQLDAGLITREEFRAVQRKVLGEAGLVDAETEPETDTPETSESKPGGDETTSPPENDQTSAPSDTDQGPEKE